MGETHVKVADVTHYCPYFFRSPVLEFLKRCWHWSRCRHWSRCWHWCWCWHWNKCCHCTMCCLYSIFSSQSNELGHDLTPHNCDIIQHIFSPTRSIARKTLLWTFLWASNSKFVIFPELYPCINYRILAFYAPIPVQIHGNSIFPPYHIQGNFEYRGILLYNVRIVQ